MLVFSLYSAVNWISAGIFSAFAILLWTGSKIPSTRIYAGISASLAIWSVGVALLMTNLGYGSKWALFFSRFNHYIGAYAGPLFLYFAFIYPKEVVYKKSVIVYFLLIEGALLYPYLATDLILRDAFVRFTGNTVQLGWTLGSYGFLFYLNFIIPFTAGIGILVYKYLTEEDPLAAKKIGYLVLGSTLGALLGLIVNVILPLFHNFTYSWLGPALTTSWVAITYYIIQKYGVLRLRMIAAVLLILLLIIILFINIFIPQ